MSKRERCKKNSQRLVTRERVWILDFMRSSLTLLAKPSDAIRILGRMRTSNPAMENSRFGLSLEYTLTKELSHSSVVRLRGNRFFMSQNTARPCACINTEVSEKANMTSTSTLPLLTPPPHDRCYQPTGQPLGHTQLFSNGL